MHPRPSVRALSFRAARVALAVAVVALAVLAWFSFHTQPAAQRMGTEAPAAPEIVESEPAAHAKAPASPQAVTTNSNAAGSAVSTLAPEGSLAGTEVDGAVKLDGRGGIVLDVDLRRLFDYLLARSGEMSEEQLRQLSEQQLAKLYPAQADALIALFRRYLMLRERMANVPKTDSVALNLDRLSALRTDVLGAEMARAFFADDEALARFALARQQLQTSAITLSAQQRREQEIALLDTLPTHLREDWENLLQQEAISAATERGDVRAQAALLDAQAQARVQQLEMERAAFEQRVRSYLAARAQAADESAREAMRARWLHPDERARVAALEAIGQEQSLFAPAPMAPAQ